MSLITPSDANELDAELREVVQQLSAELKKHRLFASVGFVTAPKGKAEFNAITRTGRAYIVQITQVRL